MRLFTDVCQLLYIHESMDALLYVCAANKKQYKKEKKYGTKRVRDQKTDLRDW